MGATSHRRATSEIVKRIVALLAALETAGAAGQPGSKVFERVELFDSENVTEAFRYLLLNEQRVAIVVPLDEEFETVISGLRLIVKRRLPVGILVSDRVLGDRGAGLWGNEQTPGAMGLMELALPVLTGLLLPNPMGVVGEPKGVSVMTIKETEKELPMRVTVALELECRGGWLEAELARGQVL